ncbi:unnamed protein product [Amoebophrya sp. A120]|nr:unnamed protein product [Amoebophrya sp. A120]|eukprot:GSA120T00004001001.1
MEASVNSGATPSSSSTYFKHGKNAAEMEQHTHSQDLPREFFQTKPSSIRVLVDDGIAAKQWKVDPSLVYQECDHVRLSSAANMAEVHQKVEQVQSYLNSLGIFKEATTVIDRGEGEDDIDVIFHLRPIKPHYSFGANVNGKGQTTAEFNFDIPCINGSCTSAKCTAKTPTWRILEGYETQASLFTKRLFGVRNLNASLDLNSSVNDLKPYSSYDEMSKSVNLNLGLGPHNLSLEAYNLRDVVLAMGQASTAMQMSRLRSIKTGCRYTWTHRTPGGFFAKWSTEVAGLTGDVNLAKGDACVSKTWSFTMPPLGLFEDEKPSLWHFTAMAAAGHAAPLDSRPLCIQDRFFLGGSNGFVNTICKGFGFRRFGPCDARPAGSGTASSPTTTSRRGSSGGASSSSSQAPQYDYLGGDTYSNFAVSLSRDIPLREQQVGRVFAFAQAASLGNGLEQTVTKPENYRVSTGFGVGFPFFPGCEFQISGCFPLQFKPTDVRESLQFGLRFQG